MIKTHIVPPKAHERSYYLNSETYERLYRKLIQAESVLNLIACSGSDVEGFENSHAVIIGAIDNAVDIVEKIKRELTSLELMRGESHA